MIELNQKQISENLHNKAKHYNWDNGVDNLYKIIQNKNCDKATALMIFWMGRPEWDLQFENRDKVDSYRLDEFDLLNEILERYIAGKYDSCQNLSFNPKNDDGFDWTNQYPELKEKFKRKIPEIMYKPVN